MLIGREREVAILGDLYQSGQAELVALYGRRRVGKTFLIDETFAGRVDFRHAGLALVDEAHADEGKRKSRMKDQLRHFHRSLTEQGLQDAAVPGSWLDAFYLLEDLLKQKACGGKRLLVFIDEIQWLDTPKAGFMTGLEAFWNGWACHRHDIMLIVCGSSSSWVLDKLVNNRGGLYDRVTHQMSLAPFNLRECELYLESNGVALSRYDIVQTYMMLGGIPYYLRYLKRGKSFAQNADALFFERGAQVDLIIERKDNVVNMCEMKFTSDEFSVDKDYHLTLTRRREMLRRLIPKKATIHSTLVTTYGLKYNAYSGDFVSKVVIDDLFAP